MATYTWNDDFNLNDALNGMLVGFPIPNSEYDLTQTGILVKDEKITNPPYWVSICGVMLRVNSKGKVLSSVPSSDYIGKTLQMVTLNMGENGAIGGDVTRSSGSGGAEGYSEVVNLTAVEPRDQFAINILTALINKAQSPETFSDATMMHYSRLAYRFAQAMMIAAADSRYGTYEGGGGEAQRSEVDVTSGSNTEKLLDNITKSVDDLTKQLKSNQTEITKISTAISTALSGTLKIDNPANDTFDIEGGGGAGTSMNRNDLNDTANPTDVITYNASVGNAPTRTTLKELTSKMIAQLDAEDKTAIHDAIIATFDNDFSTCLQAAKDYANSLIQQ
jgi:hypothetical protein